MLGVINIVFGVASILVTWNNNVCQATEGITNLDVTQWLLGDGIIMMTVGLLLFFSKSGPFMLITTICSIIWFVAGAIILFNSTENRQCITHSSSSSMIRYAVAVWIMKLWIVPYGLINMTRSQGDNYDELA
jgi:membrane-bound ClpP family serine protease